jgi:hypothetical protein
MNSKYRYYILFSIVVAFLNSCSKEDIANQKSESIIGKWFVVNAITRLDFPSQQKDTSYPLTTEFWEFREDSTFIIKDAYGYDTARYFLKNDVINFYSSFPLDVVEKFAIEKINSNSLSLYKQITPGEHFWRNFKR